MQIDVLTLFPGMFEGPFNESIVKRAADKGIVKIDIYNIRDFTHDRHHTVDDYTYGGGAGMVMKVEPICEALKFVKDRKCASGREIENGRPSVILLTPQGRLFNQQIAQELSRKEWLILVCGHYEGVDQRVSDHLVDDEISVGDFVLTGGELASMIIVDSVVRLLPGALGSEKSALEESHAAGLLEHPQYSRPAAFGDWTVPDVLVSGNHAEIARWQRQQSLLRTMKRRPDLLGRAILTNEDRAFVEKVKGGS